MRRHDRGAALRERFRFRVAADADALWARIIADPQVRVCDEPSPEPAPPHGPPLLAARHGGRIRVRHWSGAADAVSPVLTLSFEPRGEVTAVVGRIEHWRHAASFAAEPPRRAVWTVVVPLVVLAGIVAVAQAFMGSALLWALPVLLLLFAIPSSLVMLPALALWNAESRRVQHDALQAWVGRTFVPIALPAGDEDNPFR